MGSVSLSSSIIRTGDDFINYVKTSSTLARCREIHPPNKMPNEELGIAVLEVRPNCFIVPKIRPPLIFVVVR